MLASENPYEYDAPDYAEIEYERAREEYLEESMAVDAEEAEIEMIAAVGMVPIYEGEPEPDQPVPEDAVERDAYFDYRLRQIADLKAEQARNTRLTLELNAPHAEQIVRNDEWCAEQNATLDRRIEYLEGKLHMAALGYDFPHGKKSRKLPSGSFGFRTIPAKVEVRIEDKDAALAFAKTHGIPVKESVGVAELKPYVESTGLVPDGCTVNNVPPREAFDVKVAA